MDMMQEHGDMNESAALSVLEEIKALMESRLGDRLKPKEPEVEVTKVEGAPEAVEKVAAVEGEDMKSEDDEELEKMYSKLMG